MKLENQVVPIEQAKRLKELGVNAPSIFLWYKANNGYEVVYNEDVVDFDTNFSAYGVAELGVMLPVKAGDAYSEIDVQNTLSGVFICRIFNCISSKTIKNFNSPNEAEARAAMLIYLLETGLTTAAEVNERLKNA